MTKLFSRFLLAFAALLLSVGAVMHGSAFNKISSAVADSNLVSFAGNALKVLWLGDSIIQLALAGVFGLIAARPSAASTSVVVILALIPAATAVLIYMFIGNFIGAHILLASAVAAILGGLQYPGADRPR